MRGRIFSLPRLVFDELPAVLKDRRKGTGNFLPNKKCQGHNDGVGVAPFTLSDADEQVDKDDEETQVSNEHNHPEPEPLVATEPPVHVRHASDATDETSV